MKKIFFFLVFFIPSLVSAQVVITEVMYDLGPEPASDTDREWVEIFNGGSEAVDLADWRFVESGSRHTFLPYPDSGDVVLPPDTYAVIVIKPSVFLADWPGFLGKILDSSFSLKNSEGEMLNIRDPNGIDVDSVMYDPTIGGAGDGNSLQKTSSGWVSAAPTPGAPGEVDDDENDNNNDDNDDNNNDDDAESNTEPEETQSSESTTSGTMPLPPNIKAYIKNRETTIGVGVPITFAGYGVGLKDEPLLNARFLWNFGDGVTAEGENVLHTYKYAGKYIVVLEVSSEKYAAGDRISLQAVPIDVVVSRIGTRDDFFIKLHNKSSYQADLGDWLISSGGQYFRIPPKTFVQKGGMLTFSPDVTKLPFAETVSLYFPDGKEASAYSLPSEVAFVTQNNSKEVAGVSQKNPLVKKADIEPKNPPEFGVSQGENLEAPFVEVLAASSRAGNAPSFFLSEWFLALIVFISVGIGGLFFARRVPFLKIDPEEKLAHEMEIIEVEEEETK